MQLSVALLELRGLVLHFVRANLAERMEMAMIVAALAFPICVPVVPRAFGPGSEQLIATNGGPILMPQIENEDGSYGSDHAYIRALSDMMRAAFPGIPFYTNDGGIASMLEGGQIHGALAITDGEPRQT